MAGTQQDTNGHRGRRATRPNGHDTPKREWPHNLEVEVSILGGCIIRNEHLDELIDVETDTFYDKRHQIVWSAMRNLRAAGKPVDVTMLEHEIDRDGKLDAVGGMAYLGYLVNRVPTAENVHFYAREAIVLQKNRDAILTLSSALERAWTWPHDPAELVGETAGELGRYAEVETQKTTTRTRWCTDFEAFLGDEEPDDDDAIDWVIRDIIPRGEPALWGGPMKGGKTWAAMDLMVSIARGESWLGTFENTFGGPARVLGVLLEDPVRRLRKRLWELCRARHISPNDAAVREHMKITRAPLRLPDAADQRRFIAEIKAWGAQVVVVDNLTRVMVGDQNSPRDAAAFAKCWMEICSETGACLLFLHHTKKPVGDQREVDPFNELRGSNDFGACARNILVTTPLRTDDKVLAEVRMRGNLDLRRDAFVLGFQREKQPVFDRWFAKLTDLGEPTAIRDEVAKARKEKKQTKKREEKANEFHQRVAKAREICRAKGHVSLSMLALEFGLSPNAMKPVFSHLVGAGEMKAAGVRGYMFVDAEPQNKQGALL